MTTTPEILTWRSALLGLLPRWLKGKTPPSSQNSEDGHLGFRYHYAAGVVMDAVGTAFNYGLRASYPGFGDDQALMTTGRCRGIVRGPSESASGYATRLRYWRQARRRKGNAFALMEQLQAFLDPYNITFCVQYDNGVRLRLNPQGYLQAPFGYQGTAFAQIESHSWNWDGLVVPTRYWVILVDTDAALWGSDGTMDDPGLWSDLNTDDTTASGNILDPLAAGDVTPTWGSTASYAVAQGIMSLIREWNPPHAQPQCVIVCRNPSEFNSLLPSGNWNRPGDRDPSRVYWDFEQ